MDAHLIRVHPRKSAAAIHRLVCLLDRLAQVAEGCESRHAERDRDADGHPDPAVSILRKDLVQLFNAPACIRLRQFEHQHQKLIATPTKQHVVSTPERTHRTTQRANRLAARRAHAARGITLAPSVYPHVSLIGFKLSISNTATLPEVAVSCPASGRLSN